MTVKRNRLQAALSGARSLVMSQLRVELLLAFIAVVAFPLAALGLVVMSYDRTRIEREVVEMNSVLSQKEDLVRFWLRNRETELALIVRDSTLRGLALDVLGGYQWRKGVLISYMRPFAGGHTQFDVLMLVAPNGEVLASTDPEMDGENLLEDWGFIFPQFMTRDTLAPQFIGVPHFDTSLEETVIYMGMPVRDSSQVAHGSLVARVGMGELGILLSQQTGLAETEDTYMVSSDGTFLTPSVHFGPYIIGTHSDSEATRIMLEQHGEGSLTYQERDLEWVFGVYRWLPDLEVGIITHVHTSELEAPIRTVRWFSLGAVIVAGIVALSVSALVAFSIGHPLGLIAETASAVASGDLERRVDVRRAGEIGTLAEAFNSMTDRLHELVERLEERVRERTRDLEATAEIGRVATMTRNLDELLNRTVNLIRERFDFYHAQVFLIDEAGEYAVLRASTGEPGRKLLEMGHKLEVGSLSVIGQVTARNEPVIALDTEDATVVHKPNPLLPHTRSEMALPLRIGERVIGALDIQSVRPNAFSADDVRVFQAMADQLAIAIDNARLLGEARRRVEEVERLNRILLGRAWEEYLIGRADSTRGFNAIGNDVIEDDTWSPTLARAVRTGQPVVDEDDGAILVAVPLELRGKVLGAIEVEFDPGEYDQERVTEVQGAAERMALTLESARLFEQSQWLLWRERIVGEVSAALQTTPELEAVLTTGLAEIGKALRARRSAIRIGLAPDNNRPDGDRDGEGGDE